MNNLITQCNTFLKDCGLTYAFCGGYAFELFTNTKIRSHSDIDITVFDEDRRKIIDFIIKAGWNVYEPLHSTNALRLITDPNDEGALNSLSIWAIKPGCSFIRAQPKSAESNVFNYAILNEEQLGFDFIEIIFNSKNEGYFVCDKDRHIARNLDKSILFHEDIPYLAPEIILFFISDPAYIASDYHREKNNIDWDFVPPFLQRESMEWLINSLEVKYPEGNVRLEGLRDLQRSV